MPDRAGVDDNEALNRLMAVWRDGEADILARQSQVYRAITAELSRPDPNTIRVGRLQLQAERLKELESVTGAVVDDLAQQTQRWIGAGGMADVYAAGGARVGGFSYTAPHRAAVNVLAQDTFSDVLQMTAHVDADSKAWVRRVSRELTGFKLTGGQTAKAQARDFARKMRTEFTGRGITAVTYRDGSRHGFGEYAEMLLRTKTAVAYNVGTINQSKGLGILFVEILDGAECGLTAHHDPEKANGVIVPIEFAQYWPIAHPSCRRSLNPRPDVDRSNIDVAGSVQSEESRQDQKAFEAYLRARRESGAARRPRATLTGSNGAGRATPRPGPLTGASGQRAGLTGPRVDPRRAARVEARQARAEAVRAQAREVARLERVEQARRAAREAGFRGQVDRAVLDRWGVTEEQWLHGRALVNQVRGDIRAVAKKEADDLGDWLFNNELNSITRPTRLKATTDIRGGRRFVRTESGYDWIEQLDGPELARVRKRMVDSDLYTPDVISGVVRQKTNLDLSDDEAMNWLVDRWLHEDGLRSLASGRVPKYVDPDNLIPGDYALEGYRIENLFGVELDDAAGHVAQVQAEGAARFARSALPEPSAGPAPWQMEFGDYVRELEQVEDVLSRTQLGAGVDPGAEYAFARARIRELAPRDLDPVGELNPVELFESIRVTARAAGYLDG